MALRTQHGAQASRVGNAFTNMISRRLQQEIFNFGFSGNGKMELGVCVPSRHC